MSCLAIKTSLFVITNETVHCFFLFFFLLFLHKELFQDY